MAYFSRLTEIVTCNLTALLEQASDPQAALREIIAEMREGVDGALRSARTADENVERLEGEIATQRREIDHWSAEAREHVEAGREDAARTALVRRRECHDVVDGLEQQLHAAIATRDHLRTTLRALEARLADARRRQADMESAPASNGGIARSAAALHDEASKRSTASTEIETELEALKRELGR